MGTERIHPMCYAEGVPDEILDLILSKLDGPAPSATKLHQQPFYGLTTAKDTPLKTSSCVSARWRRIAFPKLFRSTRVLLGCDPLMDPGEREEELNRCATFMQCQHVGPRVESFTFEFKGTEEGHADACADCISEDARGIWRMVLNVVNPVQLTMLAPPNVLSKLTTCDPTHHDGRYTFHMPYHLLSLTQPMKARLVAPSGKVARQIFRARPWSSALLNEGSFNRYHGEYHVTHCSPPSIISHISHVRRLELSSWTHPDSTIRHLTYVAIHPTAQHMTTVFACALPWLDSLAIQLEPGSEATRQDTWQGAWYDQMNVDFIHVDGTFELLQDLRSNVRRLALKKFELLNSQRDLRSIWADLLKTPVGGDQQEIHWEAESSSVLVRAKPES